MKLLLRRTGGQGLMLQGKVDTSELPEDLAKRTQETLQPEKLRKVAMQPQNPFMVDCHEYEVTLLDDDKEVKHFKLSDAQNAPELLELLDELMREIVSRNIKSRKSAAPQKVSYTPTNKGVVDE